MILPPLPQPPLLFYLGGRQIIKINGSLSSIDQKILMPLPCPLFSILEVHLNSFHFRVSVFLVSSNKLLGEFVSHIHLVDCDLAI